MNKDNKMIKPSTIVADSELNKLADNIACLVNETKSRLAQTVNVTLVAV